MLQFFTKLRNSKKGFTLLELIVVIVILCILAAVAFPTYKGFIDQAKGAEAVANARVGYLAVQVLAAKDTDTTTSSAKSVTTNKEFIAMTKEVDGDPATDSTKGDFLTAEYTPSTGAIKVVYDTKDYTVTIDSTSTSDSADIVKK